MKVNRFGKVGVGLAAGVSLSLCLGAVAANAAGTPVTANQEDPSVSAIGTNTLVGVGSDTIQDVEYGVSQDLGTYDGTHLNLASWTATGTTALKYRSGGSPAVATAHPNGSGAGYTALKESLGISPLSGTDGVAPGDVDYSRASGFQGLEVTGGGGVVTEIPFAVDAISFAAPANSPFEKTNGGKGLTLADLALIYSGTDKYVDTVTGDLSETATGTTESIQAFLPKPGSGSRQFFLQQLNKVNSAVAIGSDKGDVEYPAAYPTTSTDPYVGSQMPDATQVQEHDASVLAAAPAGVAAIAPFSAAKFIGYHNGAIADPSGKKAGTDYVLVPFDAAGTSVLPYTGDASSNATLMPNADYKTLGAEGSAKVTREVFNIIPTSVVNNPYASLKTLALYDTFVGAGSKFCLDTKTILAYGFLADSNCGNTSRTADQASSATVSFSHTSAVAGRSTVVTATVQSNGNGGGALRVTINGKVYSATLAKGQTSVKFTVPTPKAGSISFGGASNDGFTPNLAGVAYAPIAHGSFTVAKTNASVHASAARVSHTTGGKVLVTVSATGLTPTGKVTVLIKKGSSTKATHTVSLSGGRAWVTLPKLAKGSYYVYVSYAGDSNVNKTSYAKLATLTVS